MNHDEFVLVHALNVPYSAKPKKGFYFLKVPGFGPVLFILHVKSEDFFSWCPLLRFGTVRCVTFLDVMVDGVQGSRPVGHFNLHNSTHLSSCRSSARLCLMFLYMQY